jgi:YihY family inner membrane protein
VSRLRAGYDAFDRFQRRHPWLGFPLAVRQKYGDDHGGYLAATITYYGFFSLFPLLLVLVTLLGYVLEGDPHLQRRILSTTLGQLPIVGHENLRALSGNALALAFGIVAAVWAGSGVFLAAEHAMNQLWGVPLQRRPDFLHARLRALALLLLLGGGALAATALGGAAAFGAGLGWPVQVGAIALSTLLDFGLFWVAFRLLVAGGQSWRCLRGGAAAAAVAYEGLQLLGGFYVGHVLAGAGRTYGTFATVIGLLSWIYLAAHVTLLAAEANVVATRRLWPRSFTVLFETPPTEADERALAQRVRIVDATSERA